MDSLPPFCSSPRIKELFSEAREKLKGPIRFRKDLDLKRPASTTPENGGWAIEYSPDSYEVCIAHELLHVIQFSPSEWAHFPTASQRNNKEWLLLNAVLDPWVSDRLTKRGFDESSILDHGLFDMWNSLQKLEQSSPELEFEQACLYAGYQYGVYRKLYELVSLEGYASALSERLGNARRLGDEIFSIMRDFDLLTREDAEACFRKLTRQFSNK